MPKSNLLSEVFVHKYLWVVATRIVDNNKTDESISFYDDLISMIFSFHTLEAYINYAGAVLNPELWKTERNYFSKNPYKGFDGKIRKIFELCKMNEPSRMERPYSTVWKLKLLRDSIAHAKLEKKAYVLSSRAGEMISLHHEPFNGVVTHENAMIAVDDVSNVIHLIHENAKKNSSDFWFQYDPLDEIYQHNSCETDSRQ
jgi:hypothetical protein